MSERVPKPRGRLAGSAVGNVEVNSAMHIPLPVVKVEAVFTGFAYLELMPRDELPRQPIRLATEKGRVVRWIQRIVFQRSGGEPRTNIFVPFESVGVVSKLPN